MKPIAAMFKLVVGVLTSLNMLGGIVSGIWLAFLGEWRAIGLGILGMFVSHFAITIALLPSLALSGATIAAANRRSRAGMLAFSGLNNLYIAALMTTWCLWIMSIFMSRADARSWIPMLVWSYGVAMGPWSYMASKDAQGGGGDASVATVFFAQLAYLVLMVMVSVAQLGLVVAGATFGAIMMVGVIFNTFVAHATAIALLAAPGDVEVRAS